MAVPNRLTGSLPVSIAVHLAVLALVFVIPLTAQVALPIPATAMNAFIRAVPAPPPPPAPAVRATPRPAAEPPRAPIDAPASITPERELVPSLPVTADGGVTFGPPGAIGVPMGDPGGVAPPPASAPPVPKPGGPIRAAELVQSPRKIVDVRPLYPDIARTAHVQGTVVLEAVLDRSGRVSQVRVLTSAPLLNQAAIDAVRQWRYTPSTLHGTPVEVLLTITVTFTLQE